MLFALAFASLSIISTPSEKTGVKPVFEKGGEKWYAVDIEDFNYQYFFPACAEFLIDKEFNNPAPGDPIGDGAEVRGDEERTVARTIHLRGGTKIDVISKTRVKRDSGRVTQTLLSQECFMRMAFELSDEAVAKIKTRIEKNKALPPSQKIPESEFKRELGDIALAEFGNARACPSGSRGGVKYDSTEEVFKRVPAFCRSREYSGEEACRKGEWYRNSCVQLSCPAGYSNLRSLDKSMRGCAKPCPAGSKIDINETVEWWKLQDKNPPSMNHVYAKGQNLEPELFRIQALCKSSD